jgi:chemotaxis protein MotB
MAKDKDNDKEKDKEKDESEKDSKNTKKNKNIIIKKIKKIEGGGHHGGAWKVAYADFVTAMMAFFLLMWLVSSSSEKTLQGISEYFTPTEAISDKAGLGFDGGVNPNMEEGVSAINATSSSLIYGSPSKGHRVDAARLPGGMSDAESEHLISIMNSITKDKDLQNYSDNIAMDITEEGLRIQIMDSSNRPIFKPNTSELEPFTTKILTVIGKMIRNQPNYISITGHTATINGGADNDKAMDPWKISSDRAQVVRSYLTKNVIEPKQIAKIIGLADREPFDSKNPSDPRNIRVAITLLNKDSVSNYQKSVPKYDQK